ncbi:hypothetical protein SAMN04490185_2823 [Pseudomonas frederiksbergensis]|uniref:Glycosyltransferase RgtA/B/C/D-like domain-containing protein n=1 Tax=Pseudomonas frederiksbergensis TaxID=104087 RepID=A0A1H4Y6Q0_9PSED|nr:hypothetical protein [Pseudomonas frederiksbergensis]SED12758.1 hypothetical protein SAMN04490185_2823 [Pseudomonas frederiksbergensis]
MKNRVIGVSPNAATDKYRIIKFLAGHTLPALIIVAAIWIPFGFAMTGVVEEWLVLEPFTTHGLFFLTDLNSPMSAHALRPLTVFPQAIAYFLDPQSFKYWHIMLILSLLVKAWCLSLITTKITNSLKWGIAASVLFLVYPADTMQLSFRSLHINWSLALALLATTISLYTIESKNQALSILGSVISAVIFTAACAMYEASLLLSILPLLVIWAKGGNSHAIQTIKQNFAHFSIWLSGAIIYILYVIITARLISTYQGDIIGQSSIIQTIENSLPKLFSVGLLRSILGGWFDATRITTLEFTNYWYALAALTLLAICTTLTLKSSQNNLDEDKETNTLIKARRLLCIGIVLVILGYAPFLISVPHQYISQRTFLFATLGAVFFSTGLLIAVYKLSKTFTAVTATALVFIGLSFQLYQFNHYVRISNTQVSILHEISEKFDGNARGKKLLILDNSSQIGHTWMLPVGNLRGALTYLYGHTIDSVEVCHLPSREWQKADGLARKGFCEENTQEWILHYPDPVSGPGMDIQTKKEDVKLDKANLIVININSDSNVKPPSSQTTLPNKTLPSFANSIATPVRYLSFTNEKRKDFYHGNFGKWWSMEIPTKGSGWREGEWKVNSFYHESAAWKTSKASYLYFQFYAKQKKYTLSGNFDYIVSSSIKDSMKLLLNGKEIPIHWQLNGEFKAPVTPEQLVSGTNELKFISDVDEKYYGFSARLSWVEIKISEQQ